MLVTTSPLLSWLLVSPVLYWGLQSYYLVDKLPVMKLTERSWFARLFQPQLIHPNCINLVRDVALQGTWISRRHGMFCEKCLLSTSSSFFLDKYWTCQIISLGSDQWILTNVASRTASLFLEIDFGQASHHKALG